MPSWGTQTKYGDFEIVGAREGKPRLLGKGSFGKTFEAVRVDKIAGQDIREYVAVKVLDPALLTNASDRYQFIQELVALTKYKHSNLIHYIRCGEQNGEVYYAMELCRGGDLNRMARRYGPLPEKVVGLIALQVAAGLREVHQRHRLVHRDLKPSNIMLVDEVGSDVTLQYLGYRFEEQDSLCRIVDFGLVDFTMNAQEVQQRFVGSPMYASPEQIAEQPVDRRSDIYSLGMTLWYLLQGKGPLLDARGEPLSDSHEAMNRHTRTEEHDAELPKNLSPQFRGLLNKMLAKQPEQRFSTAVEMQAAIREYLDAPAGEVRGPTAFTITRISGPLDASYTLEGALPSRLAHQSYAAVEKANGQRVKLNAVATVRGNDTSNIDALTRYLGGLAEISRRQSLPPALLPVREVILATDILACTEDIMPHVVLGEVLRARAVAKRNISFAEAVTFLRPVADALDFLLQHGRETVFLPCDEVWLCADSVTSEAQDYRMLTRPLTEWERLTVRFSMLCLPVAQSAALENDGFGMHETMSGSVRMSDADLHPVPVFVRLVYRTLNGSEVAAAAQFTPNAYVPAVTLCHASNNLLRDLLCRQKPWTTVVSVLKDLCGNEGVPWRRSESSVHPSSTPDDVAPEPEPPPVPAPAPAPAIKSTAPAMGSSVAPKDPPPALGSSVAPAAADDSVGSVGASANFPTLVAKSLLGANTVPPPLPRQDSSGSSGLRAAEKLCEVVSPGVVRSPYDPDGKEQNVPPDQWAPAGRVCCQVTQKYFRLPRKLDLLQARLVAPGVIQSPYAPPGAVQRVAWEDWMPGHEIVCSESAKRITLPMELPLPEAALSSEGSGVVISPYDRNSHVAISPAQWEPGAEIGCPATRMTFLLPKELPPLEAMAEIDRPGALATPYSPTVTWSLPAEAWTAGSVVTCPVSGKPLTLPAVVEKWPAEATLVDAGRRLVSDPYRPGKTFEVPAPEWISRKRTLVPETKRPVILPAGLPPLIGELIPGQMGVVRSPYSGESVSLTLAQWVPGAEIVCPKTKATFVMPAELPEWIPPGEIAGLPTGKVKSPYDSHPVVDVAPTEWLPGQSLQCPATGRRFTLPSELPLLEGIVKEGEPGKIRSPFADEWQTIALDDWKPGARLKCPTAGREFVLPAKLEEWLVDGTWVAGKPGVIRSPFRPNPELEVSADEWKSGGLLTCPASTRHFRLPEDANLSTLAFEKDAFQYASAEPESTEESAAQALQARHRGATAAQVKSVWDRHQLGTVEQRKAGEKVGELVPGMAGFVWSPYGAQPRVSVTPSQWVDPSATAHCPETGRRFQLPPNRPPLEVQPVENDPGTVISPFAPEKPFQVPPDQWTPGQAIKCPESGHPLCLPARLPEWKFEGALKDGQPGIVFSPFGRKRAMNIRAADWGAGVSVTCLETGFKFTLPANLPPMAGTIRAGALGRALSPYAAGPDVNVPRRKWKPGTRLTCPVTGRPFLLPPSLPPWPGAAIPWKLVIPIGAVALIAGIWFATRHPNGDGGGGDVNPTPEPAPVVDSNPKGGPLMASLDGGIRVSGWKSSGPPTGLKWTSNSLGGKTSGEPRVEPMGADAFKVSFDLPAEARKYNQVKVQLSLPGWAPVESVLAKNGDGFTSPGRQTMVRNTAQLALNLPGNKSDYDNVTAVWSRPLPDEPEASPPPEKSVSVKIAAQTEPVPTGIYDLKLEAQGAKRNRIRSSDWVRGAEIRPGAAPLTLPPSIAGEYWGLFNHDAAWGYFMILRIGDRLSSLSMERVNLPRANKLFRPEWAKPLVGDIWRVGDRAFVDKPGTVRFTCAVFSAKTDWSVTLNPDGTAVAKPALAADNGDIRGLHAYLESHLEESAREVLKLGQDGGEKVYDLREVTDLIANQNYARLRRYTDFTTDVKMNAEDKLYSAIEFWRGQIRLINQAGGVKLYPINTALVKQEYENHDWGVAPEGRAK